MNFLEALSNGRMIVDGGMGTMLQAMGLTPGEQSAQWCLTHPDAVLSVHDMYIGAGCDIVTANTFGADPFHAPDCYLRQVDAGVHLAVEATTRRGHGFAALNVGPTGRLLQPFGDLNFEQAVRAFREIAKAGEQAGAQLILIETMTDLVEMRAAVLGCREGSALPIIASMSMGENGRLLTGADVRGMIAMLESLGVCAVGFNCGAGPEQMLPVIQTAFSCAHVPILASPNAGLPEMQDGRTVFRLSPDDFAPAMRDIARAGARLLGGCCGTTPAHIAAMIKLCASIAPAAPKGEEACTLCSYSRTVVLGGAPLLIGERINPTGKPLMKQALRDGDMDFLLREAVRQQDAGADMLDVNVGLPGTDEKETLPRAVLHIQSACDLPLQLDCADPDALARALRVYAGKALVNSVNGKEEVMSAVFPLVRRYGGAVVALLLDENGIPNDTEGRLRIARRILARARIEGIAQRDIVFDALTMAVSADPSAARVTLETVRALKRELGVHTVLGVSNASFGLPCRECLNASFLSMAVAQGLDAAIINPLQPGMTDALRASSALMGLDEHFEQYIAAHAAQPSAAAPPAGVIGLQEAIQRGLAADAAHAANKALGRGESELELMENALIPALRDVGDSFEKGTLFLPQLLTAADAARAAFDALRAHMAKAGIVDKPRGTVILATVQGDIHDIGKNIVKALLVNYHFHVIDLGRDVAPDAIMAALRQSGAQVVGLSALMTTTVPAMRDTVRRIKEEAPGTYIMCGGAVLTPELAADMGADGCARDAMAAVRFTEHVYCAG